jgi:hypothetical protein
MVGVGRGEEAGIMTGTLEQLAELVGQKIELKKRGKRFVGLCPFHEDHRPSLSLFEGRDGKPRYYCHACGALGDTHDWLAFVGKSPGRFTPDPELQRKREEGRCRERMISAFRDRQPDCPVPDWALAA